MERDAWGDDAMTCEACRDVLALVAEQAEDEGLWCEARTIVEAYLMQELRRLHALIEARANGEGAKP